MYAARWDSNKTWERNKGVISKAIYNARNKSTFGKNAHHLSLGWHKGGNITLDRKGIAQNAPFAHPLFTIEMSFVETDEVEVIDNAMHYFMERLNYESQKIVINWGCVFSELKLPQDRGNKNA